MGREIRRVPPNWKHPTQECPHSPWAGGCDEAKRNGGRCYRPMFDREFGPVLEEWVAEKAKWDAGEHEDRERYPDTPFEEYFGETPNSLYYRSYKDEEATWYQGYQTVSEGSPVTPPFETQEELAQYLMNHGDFWDQRRERDGRLESAKWPEDAARRYVFGAGWAPSAISGPSGLVTARDPEMYEAGEAESSRDGG